MEQPLIKVELPQQRATFRPDEAPVAFPVIVHNVSEQFAQFRLEVLAAGADPNLQADWCQRSPEVSVATPPGDQTTFTVEILNAPILDFIGTIDLTIKVFSPQLPGEIRRIVKLTIEPGNVIIPFSIRLPSSQISVYPRNVADIPVQIRNLSHHPLEVLLHLSGVSESWIPNGTKRQRLLNPRETAELTFRCQPPAAQQAPSQAYPFQITLSSPGQSSIRADGVLQVLPVGFIKFAVTPPQCSIPEQNWLPNLKTYSAHFQATFENVSNLVQSIELDLKGHDRNRCTYQTPDITELSPAAFAHIPFEITSKRPWIGLAKTLRLEAVAQPQLFNSVDVEPAVQPIELRVLPIIPLWLVLALLAALAALLALLLQPQPISHTDFVNAVRFSSDALSVVSGSDDCTIRRWTIEGAQLQPEGVLTNAPPTTCNDQPLQAPGVLAFTQRTVFSLEFLPENNDRVAAGLADGTIQVWDLPTRQPLSELRDRNDQTEDRVFDLAFTKDALTLFSGHGSGKIRIWQRSIGQSFDTNTPTRVLMLPKNRPYQVKYQVRALALSPDNQRLVSAGSKNTLVLWDWTAPDSPPQLLLPQASEEEYVWDAVFAPNSQWLATSDSRGYITLWDLEHCQFTKSTQTTEETDQSSSRANCRQQRHWRAADGEGNIAVRSLKFNANGTHLVSAGDDGRVKLWDLTTPVPTSEVLQTSPEKISSIDLLDTEQDLLVLSGGDDRQVRLQRTRPSYMNSAGL